MWKKNYHQTVPVGTKGGGHWQRQTMLKRCIEIVCANVHKKGFIYCADRSQGHCDSFPAQLQKVVERLHIWRLQRRLSQASLVYCDLKTLGILPISLFCVIKLMLRLCAFAFSSINIKLIHVMLLRMCTSLLTVYWSPVIIHRQRCSQYPDLLLPPPRRLCFSWCLFVCLPVFFVCSQLHVKTIVRIFVKILP